MPQLLPRLALFEPDIPQNAGTLMRLCACMGMGLDIIEPCGFVLSDKNLKRAGMDYMQHLDLALHRSWDAFRTARAGRRLVLLTTKGAVPYTTVDYTGNDILLLGRESSGVPDHVHAAANLRVVVPMQTGLRSLNVAITAAMVTGEAIRQINAAKV